MKKDEKKLALMRKIFKAMSKFSLFCYIRPKSNLYEIANESDFDSKKFLIDHFGSNRVSNCVNRLDTRSKKCPISVCNELNETLELDNMDSWFRFDEIIGWATNKLTE